MFRWLRELFRRSPRDHTNAFPRQLQTTESGILNLKVSNLRADGQIIAVFCRYEPAAENGPSATFHPDPGKRPEPTTWISLFDRRVATMRQNWRARLLAQTSRLAEEMDGWMPEELGADALIESLQLNRILVSDDGSVSLGFASSVHLHHHDLTVELDSNDRITGVSVDG